MSKGAKKMLNVIVLIFDSVRVFAIVRTSVDRRAPEMINVFTLVVGILEVEGDLTSLAGNTVDGTSIRIVDVYNQVDEGLYVIVKIEGSSN